MAFTQEEEAILDTVDLFEAGFIIAAYEAAVFKRDNTTGYPFKEAVERIAKDYKKTEHQILELVDLNSKHNFDVLLEKLKEVAE